MRHLEEGAIHAWLDGALRPDEAAALTAHLEHCAACRDRVVEARGLIAGSARILAALDGVGSGIVPSATAGRTAADVVRPPPAITRRRSPWLSRPLLGAAAALVVVVSGTILVRRNAGAPVTSSEVLAIPKYPSPPPTLLPDSLRNAARNAIRTEVANRAAADSEQPKRAASELDAAVPPPVARNSVGDSVTGKVLNEQAQLSRDLAIERKRAAVQSDSLAARVGVAKSAAGMSGIRRRDFAEPPRKTEAVAAAAASQTMISSDSGEGTCYALEYKGMRGDLPARLPTLVFLREDATLDSNIVTIYQGFIDTAINSNFLVLEPRAVSVRNSAADAGQRTGDFARAAKGVLEFAWRDGVNTVRVTLPPADSAAAAAVRVGEAVSAGQNGAAVWSARVRAVRTKCDSR